MRISYLQSVHGRYLAQTQRSMRQGGPVGWVQDGSTQLTCYLADQQTNGIIWFVSQNTNELSQQCGLAAGDQTRDEGSRDRFTCWVTA